MPPSWLLALILVVCALAVFLVPNKQARLLRKVLIDSDSARLVGLLAAIFGFVVVVSTAYQIIVDLEDRREEREVRRAEAIERAWQRLLVRAPGNTGKGAALTVLVNEHQGLQNLDLSCRAIGDWNSEFNKCESRAILAGVEVPEAEGQTDLFGLNLNDAVVIQSAIYDALFIDVRMNGTRIANSVLVQVGFRGEITSPNIEATALLDTWFSELAPGSPGRISRSNISGTVIPWLAQLDAADLATNYFWADWPPLHAYPSISAPAPSTFFNDDILSRLLICRPPKRADGSVVPHLDRTPRLPSFDCDRMTIADARDAYPRAYARVAAAMSREERDAQ
ncbi:MAG: DUF2065 family protein [Mesorhizobium sp.]|nr:MAG: DUF2065 family protein [Mesorhizobium sp.]